MLDDKRETPRIPVQDQARLNVPGESGSETCLLDNVSQGGLRFSASRELAVGSRVELRVAAPEGETEISLLAQILRVAQCSATGRFDYACKLEAVENA